MYGKIFSSMWTGSMRGAGSHIFSVWAYILSGCDKHGCIELNPDVVAFFIGCSTDEVYAAIQYLEAPDPKSRSKEEDGKRIIREGEYQYRVVNYSKYSKIANEEERRESNRVSKAASRHNVSACVSKCQQPSADVTTSQHVSTVSAHVDVDVDVNKTTPPTPSERGPRRRRGREEILGAFPRPIVDFALEATDRYRHLTRDGKPVRCDIPATCTNLERLHREHKLDLDACREILALHLEDPGNYPPDLANIFGPGKPGTIPRWLTLHRAVMTLKETHA